MSTAVTEEVAAQRQRISALDQRAGYFLSASAILVGLTAPEPRAIGHHYAVTAGGLAALAVVAAITAILPIVGSTIDPRPTLAKYAFVDEVTSRQRILATRVTVYERDERALRLKGWAVRASAVFLAAAVVTVVLGVVL